MCTITGLNTLKILEEMIIYTGSIKHEVVPSAICKMVLRNGKKHVILELSPDQKLEQYGERASEGSLKKKSATSDLYQLDKDSATISSVPFKWEILDGKKYLVAQQAVFKEYSIHSVEQHNFSEGRLHDVANGTMDTIWTTLSECEYSKQTRLKNEYEQWKAEQAQGVEYEPYYFED